jgi:ABC-type multidrug transport system fused ATPase/permease subunit
MKLLVDNAIGRHPHLHGCRKSAVCGSHGPVAILVFSVIAMSCSASAAFCSMWGDFVKQRVNTGMILDFKTDLFNHLQRLSFSYHDRTTVGIRSRVNNDTSFISVMIWSNFRALLKSLLTLITILWILLKLDWQLALLAVAAAPVQYLVIGFYNKLFKDKWQRVNQLETDAQNVMQESLTSLRACQGVWPGGPRRGAIQTTKPGNA